MESYFDESVESPWCSSLSHVVHCSLPACGINITEAPEEVVDNRCLFDKLQEQKQIKQDEYDEQYALSEFLLSSLHFREKK